MTDFGESTPSTLGDDAHNRYPREYHCALQRITRRFDRPLTRFQRSGWTGAAKCADVVWGGDPTTVWGYDGLASVPTQLLSMGLSGVARWGTDIGGYNSFGPLEQLDDELLTRWMELGALLPVMRTKKSGLAVPSYDRPQVYDEAHIDDWQRLTALHTQLNPYLQAADATYRRTGLPIARALVLPLAEIRRGPRRHRHLDARPVAAGGAGDRGGRARAQAVAAARPLGRLLALRRLRREDPPLHPAPPAHPARPRAGSPCPPRSAAHPCWRDKGPDPWSRLTRR